MPVLHATLASALVYFCLFAFSSSVYSSSKKSNSPLSPDNKIIVGEAEYIKIQPGNVLTKARIDTGAKDTSLGAYDIQEFERDGEKWVTFYLPNETGNPIKIRKKIIGTTLIKQQNNPPLRRYEVQMTVILGNQSHTIKVNLADRQHYTFPALVGRNFLTGHFIVDPSRKYSQGLPKK